MRLYSCCVRDLLTATDSACYQSIFINPTAQWSPAFIDYYKASLEEAVMFTADFTTRHLGTTAKSYIGVMNNISKSFNRVLKDFQNWKVIICFVHSRNCRLRGKCECEMTCFVSTVKWDVKP